MEYSHYKIVEVEGSKGFFFEVERKRWFDRSIPVVISTSSVLCRRTSTQLSAIRVRYSAVNGPKYDNVPDAITISPTMLKGGKEALPKLMERR